MSVRIISTTFAVGRSARSEIPQSFKHPAASESVYTISDLVRQPSLHTRLLRHGIHAICPDNQRIMIDSGGFQFLKTGKFPMNWTGLIKFYNGVGADFGVSLDRPLTHVESTARAKTVLRQNLARYVSMRGKAQTKLTIIPVLHGTTPALAEWECSRLMAIDQSPLVIGLGGIVPKLTEITRNVRYGRDLEAKAEIVRVLRARISIARESFPRARLHIFGAGGTVSIALALRAGADSVDSSGWRIRAAYGCILGPWGRQLRIQSRMASPTKFAALLSDATVECECPICHQTPIPKKVAKLLRSFEARAIHNLWMQFSDLERVRARLSERIDGLRAHPPIGPLHPLVRLLGEAL
jgi:7-cyano-7-deazaguanine tRNA-ribosyltransferase